MLGHVQNLHRKQMAEQKMQTTLAMKIIWSYDFLVAAPLETKTT